MKNHAMIAHENFKKGYNCAQAVFLAFAEEMNMDEVTAAKLSSSFGGGMGKMREVCGAVSGALYMRLPRKASSIYAALLTAMMLGRIAWGAVRVLFAGLSSSAFTWAAFMAGAFTSAIPGIILHIALIPVIVLALERALPWLKQV